jgi:type VI secretion system secreted protein VgrG
MAGDFSQETRLIQWAAGDISNDVFIRRMHYEESLGRMFECELELQTRNVELTVDDLLMQTVGIALRRGDGKIRRINGTIIAVKQIGIPSKERLNEFRAIVAPWMWFMTRRSDCKIFQKQDVKQILKAILENNGVGEIEEIYSGQYKEKDFVVQYKETMYNFFSRIGEEEGIYSFVKHLDDGGQKVVLCDDSLRAETIEGYETVFLVGDTARDEVNEEAFETWTGESRVEPAKYALRAFDYMTNKVVEGAFPKGGEDAESAMEIFEYPAPYEKTDEADHYAQVRAEELKSRGQIYIATGDVRGLQPGFKFKLQGSPRQADNREWFVVSYKFSADNGPIEGVGGDDEDFEAQVAMIPADKPYRLARATEKPLITGPQTAIVVGPDSEEIYTDDENLARVKVRFHWDRHAEDENCSCWVRVSQPWAGKQYGFQFTPRKGQEVIIEFLEGDPDKPIITGRVYNGVNTPQFGNDKKNWSGIYTNSTKGGGGYNAIAFVDTKDDEAFYLKAQKFMSTHVLGDTYGQYDKKFDIRIDGNHVGRVKGAYSMSVHGNHLLSVGGEDHVTVKGDRFTKLDGNDDLKLKGDQKVEIKGEQNIKITGKRTFKTDADEMIDAKSIHMKASSGIFLDGGQEIHLKAMKVVLEGTTNVTVKVGGNFVVISPAGVDINGTMTKINAGGSPQSGSGASPQGPAAGEDPDEWSGEDFKDELTGGSSEEDSHENEEAKTCESPAGEALESAAEEGTPFCEECEAARQEDEQTDAEEERLRQEEEQVCSEEQQSSSSSSEPQMSNN